MEFAESERGVSAIIGFIFVFAIVVFSFVGYQAVAVPNQNAEIEFNHNQKVNDDVAELRSDLVEAADTGDTRSTTVRLGTTYPSRAFALNPAPPSGTLSTTNQGEMSLSTTGGASVESASTLCGTGGDPVFAHTLTYQPSYNEYESAPDAGYDNGVFFRQFSDETLAGDQALVDGETLRLRPVTTDYSESGVDAVTADLLPTERIGRDTVTVEGNGERLIATIPSRLDAATWNDLLARSDVSANPNGDRVDIVIDPSSTTEYTVLCEPVGINRAPEASPPDERDAAGTGDSSSATTVEYVEGSAEATGGQGSRVVFALENTGSVPSDIDFISLDSTNASAEFVEGGGAGSTEVELNTTGTVEANISIGGSPEAFDTQGSIPAGVAAEFTVADFKGPSTNPGANSGGEKVDMSGSSLLFTLYFEDGSEATYNIDVS